VDRTVASTRRAIIALGSNMGDRRAAVAFAAGRLSFLLANFVLSDLIETEPEGDGLHDQMPYINAVASGETSLSARDLLTQLLEIEQEYGRERPFPKAPRTLDLDLILLGDLVAVEQDLEVPHPRFRERFFVLGPLAEIAPDVVDPVTGLRAAVLLRNLLRDESR
jgi:2-amino-4-hydroxy-6-hydroxymethyldihydropteridine diphosphokinase